MTAAARRKEGLPPLTPLGVLALFQTYGAVLWAEGGRVRFTGPMRLPEWLLAEASRMKPALLELLTSGLPPPAAADREALTAWLEAEARSTPGVRIIDPVKARDYFEGEALRLLRLARKRFEEQAALPEAVTLEPPAAAALPEAVPPAPAAAAGQDQGAEWGAEDWLAFFEERAAIAEFDGGLPRAEAEALVYEACVAEWLAGAKAGDRAAAEAALEAVGITRPPAPPEPEPHHHRRRRPR